jgi:hypothetical protein
MRRRDFIKVVAGSAVAWPLAARAQRPERMRRIGVILGATADDAEFQAWFGAFLQGLQQSDWSIGQNVRIDTRWATANAAEIRRHEANWSRSRLTKKLRPNGRGFFNRPTHHRGEDRGDVRKFSGLGTGRFA